MLVKITELNNIGSNISYQTLIPVVDTAGTATTEKANLQIVGNLILNEAGGSNFPRAAQANIALSVANAAQPNITSVGNLTSLNVIGSVTANNFIGNIIGNITNAVFATTAGTVVTNAQPNITSLGTLLDLSVTGNINSNANVYANWIISNSYISGNANPLYHIPSGNLTGVDGNVSNVLRGDGSFGTFTGVQGIQGVQGLQGLGSQGIQGTQGVQGLQGLGSQGIQGTFGLQGVNGFNGSTVIQYICENTGGSDPSGLGYFSSNNSSLASTGSFKFAYANLSGAPSEGFFDTITYALVNGITVYMQLTVQNSSNNGLFKVASVAYSDPGNGGQYTVTIDGGAAVYGYGNFTVGDVVGVAFSLNGAQGIQGIQGIQSLQGLQGTFGLQGIQGVSGAGSLPLANGNSNFNVATIDGNATITSNGATYTFGADGVLTLPGNTAVIEGSANLVTIYSDSGSSLDYLLVSSNNVTEVVNQGNVQITSNNNGTSRTWEFDSNGTLTAPGDITLSGDITGTAGANTLILKAQPTTDTYIQLNSIVDSTISIAANLEIVTDSSNTSQSWTFDTNGDLTVPNYIKFDGNTFIGDEPGAGTPGFRITAPLGYEALIQTDSDITGNNWSWSFGNDGNFTVPGNIIGASANVDIVAGSNTWIFDNTGNLTLPGNTFAINFANGTQASAPLVDITDTNGLTTVYYPTFVEDRTNGQIVRADVDLSYRTDTNTLSVGNITGNTNGYTLGYLDIPQVAASNTTIALTDAGKHYYSTTAGNLTLTIPNNATTSFATGTAINIVVQASGNILVNATSGVTLFMAGSATSGNRAVGAYGMATLLKVASDTWFINGTGVY